MTGSAIRIRHFRWTTAKSEPKHLTVPVDGGGGPGPSSFGEKITELEDELVRFHLGPGALRATRVRAADAGKLNRLESPTAAA